MASSLRRFMPIVRPSCVILKRGLHSGASVSSQCDAERIKVNGENAITFNNFRLAYSSKTTGEIMRALFVLGFCRREFLVDHSEKLVRVGRRILGRKLFNKLMKATFFGQFVAGENDKEVKALIDRLRKFHVSVILNYAVEDDEQGGHQEKSGLIQHGNQARKDPREKNLVCFIKTIDDMAEATKGNGFAAIKVTALSRPETLMAVTSIIRNSQSYVNRLINEPSDPRPIIGRDLRRTELQSALWKMMVHDSVVSSWLEITETGKDDRVVDSINWKKVFDGTFGLADISLLPDQTSLQKFSESDNDELRHLLRRMDAIAKHAHDTNTRVLVDAEQSYFQAAIARLSLELMRKYNQDRPSFYNTYQCYLKETYAIVKAHLALARQENFIFGAKVVRGAYMDLERQRATELNYPDPINPNFEATTANYKNVVGYILDDIKQRNKSHIVIAGHNEETVKWAVSQVEQHQFPRKSRNIYFGQLLGMCDQLTFTLADFGYNTVKCVPYGTVDEVLPYLIRRAQENRGVLDKTTKETTLLWRELMRRMKSGDLRHSPNLTM